MRLHSEQALADALPQGRELESDCVTLVQERAGQQQVMVLVRAGCHCLHVSSCRASFAGHNPCCLPCCPLDSSLQ